jgi:hypothetical protein
MINGGLIFEMMDGIVFQNNEPTFKMTGSCSKQWVCIQNDRVTLEMGSCSKQWTHIQNVAFKTMCLHLE